MFESEALQGEGAFARDRSQAEQAQPFGDQRPAGGWGTIAAGIGYSVGGRARLPGAPLADGSAGHSYD